MNYRCFTLTGNNPTITYKSDDLEFVLGEIVELEYKLNNYKGRGKRNIEIITDISFNYTSGIWEGIIIVKNDDQKNNKENIIR